MKNELSYDDLCFLILSNLSGNGSEESVKRYLKAIYRTILRQLELNQKIYFKGFGYFEIKERKSGERWINNPKTKEKVLVYVKPKYSIFFKASENFDYAINENDFKIISDKGVKRKKKKTGRENLKCNNADDLLKIANRNSGKE